jgi:hypothetical protein
MPTGAAGTRTVRIRFDGDAQGLQRASQQGGKAIQGWRARFGEMNRAAVTASTGVLGAAVLAGKHLVDLASQAQQSLGAVDSVFGESAAQVKQWADQAATSVGLSANAYRELATVTGAQLRNMGVAQDQVAGQTDELIRLGADLAATYGGTTADAVAALGSLLRGETDPIERYGVSIKAADINARLAAKGLDDLEGAEAKTAKTQALMALLTEQTAAAQGQFSRETDTAAGQTQRAQAQFENLRTELGAQLLPIYTQLMEFVSSTALPFLKENQDAVRNVALAVVGLSGFVLAANGVYKVYRATMVAVTVATKVWTVAQKALNLAMRMNPIGIVISVLAALVAGLVAAYQRSETFRRIVQSAMRGVQTAFGWVLDRGRELWQWFKDLPGNIGQFFGGLADTISRPFRSAFDSIRSWWNDTVAGFGFTVPDWIPGIGGREFRIPRMHTGGIFHAPAGRTEGLALLRDGERVTTPEQDARDGQITVNVMISSEEIAGIAAVEVRRGHRLIKRRVLAGAVT